MVGGSQTLLTATGVNSNELFNQFTVDVIALVREVCGAECVRHVVDIGCGPGVAATTFATEFPSAMVTAVDSSPAMLARARLRADELGVGPRRTTLLAELLGGLDEIEPADVICASASLHHVGDEVAALRALRDRLAPDGLVITRRTCRQRCDASP